MPKEVWTLFSMRGRGCEIMQAGGLVMWLVYLYPAISKVKACCCRNGLVVNNDVAALQPYP